MMKKFWRDIRIPINSFNWGCWDDRKAKGVSCGTLFLCLSVHFRMKRKVDFTMATVTMTLNPGDQPTKEQIEEIQAASEKTVNFTESVLKDHRYRY